MKRPLIAAALAAVLATSATAQTGLKTAVFAGGCFWSIERAFEAAPGVVGAVSGYSGGRTLNPTYEDHEGHLEAVKVTYDPSKTSYARLTEYFFRNIDPTDPGGQICDRGHSYTTAVFFNGDAERRAAEAAKARVGQVLRQKVATVVRPASRFWDAEAYHQDFAKRNPAHYERYRIGCGRDQRIKAVWAAR